MISVTLKQNDSGDYVHPRLKNPFGDPKPMVCGVDLRDYFDVPENAKTIRLIFHERPGKQRHGFRLLGYLYVESLEKEKQEFVYYYFGRWLRERFSIGDVRYVEVQYTT